MRAFWILLAAAVLGAFGLVACGGDDEPGECGRRPEGDFFFTVTPRLPSGADSTADIERTIPGAVLDSILVGASFVPPIITYRFHAPGFPRLEIQLTDLLANREPDAAKRGFPVVKGETYTLGFELNQRIVPPAMGIRILDAQGLRFFGVNDWRPAGTAGAQIFEGGYGGLNADGELKVFFADVGCTSLDLDYNCYAEFTNHRLDFLIGAVGPLELWSGDTGTLGAWRIHVHKGAKVVPQAGCFPALLDANGVSFTVERVGLRAP